MTDSNQPTQPAPTDAYIRWPWMATVLLLAGLALLFFGQVYASGGSDVEVIFKRAFGVALGAVGGTSIIAGLALVGVRSIAQQHLNQLQRLGSRSLSE